MVSILQSALDIMDRGVPSDYWSDCSDHQLAE
jgi:hypothetical protein